MKAETTSLYIRFGEIPENGKSKVYQGDVVLREEAGVSVWRAVQANGQYYPVLPDEPNENAIADYFDFIMNCKCNVYLVTGKEICIEGADREPLLTDVTIIEDITWMYKKDVKEEKPKSNATSAGALLSRLSDMGVDVRLGDLNTIKNLYDFYHRVRRCTPNCSWSEKYPDYKTIIEDVSKNNLFMFVKDDRIVGTISCEFIGCGCEVFHRIAVDPSMQGTGLSKVMIQYVIEEMKQKHGVTQVSVCVWKSNIQACKLYTKLGFVKTGTEVKKRDKIFDVWIKDV